MALNDPARELLSPWSCLVGPAQCEQIGQNVAIWAMFYFNLFLHFFENKQFQKCILFF
jgi:hypothetical protein